MSKIEEALKKARALEGAVTPASSPFQQRLETPVQTGPAHIRRMAEPFRRDRADLAAKRIIYSDMHDTRVLNAFRGLRTTVVQRTGGRGAVIMVATMASDGGGSFVALNLGAAIALDENHTALVVDCNFNQPSLHVLTQEPDAPGLSDYLMADGMAIETIIHEVGIPRLRVIPAGRGARERGEYFTLTKLRQLVAGVKSRYPDRFVIIDAPPLSEAADVRVLEELCDHVLLVVPYGRNTEGEVEQAMEAIPQQKLLGAVFNDEPRIAVAAE